MKLGKLPPEVLERLLEKLPLNDPRVLLGPAIGEDAALIDWGDRLLVAKTDPVTFAADMLGWYAVQVNANDVACRGATPKWFLATILLPVSSTRRQVETIFSQLGEACRSLNISLIGGHTEVTTGVKKPIVVGCMLGEVERGKEVTTSGANIGDAIVVTKGIAIEGTALLARDAEKSLQSSGLSMALINKCKALLFYPGISVVRDALIACSVPGVNCLHDPTEGGLATGLHEVAKAANVGINLELERVPVLPETREVCRALNLNPLGLLASGCLIITLPQSRVTALVKTLKGECIEATQIGEVTPPEDGIVLATKRGKRPLPVFKHDELARFFENRTGKRTRRGRRRQ